MCFKLLQHYKYIKFIEVWQHDLASQTIAIAGEELSILGTYLRRLPKRELLFAVIVLHIQL